jgi:hypothetical protein
MQRSELSPKLQLALNACRAAGPMLTGEICLRSISPQFKAKGVTYHDLAKLARLGYLTRTGEGRYAVCYRLTTPKRHGVTRRSLQNRA